MKKTDNKKAVPPDALKWQTCAHSDADGRCQNPESNGQGGECKGCEEYQPKGGDNAQRSTPDARLSTEVTRACACAREDGALPEVTAEEVVKGYVDAVNGVLSVVRFGAMLLCKERVLTRENAKNDEAWNSGTGLRAWLAENVPGVNYKTAMRMKGTAEAVAAGIGAKPSALYRCLNPDPKALPDETDADELIALRDRLVEIVHGRSERSLVLWLKGGAPAAPDDPESEDTGKAEVAALDAAKRFARAVSDALKCLDNRKKKTISADVARTLREALGLKGLAWLAKVLEEAEG